ncbi:MAG: hypothetical protein MJH08_16855, partial [Hyphomicrobiales bacterium]|nr:hypothetical protein [Hyphomicrobiales bacterium]
SLDIMLWALKRNDPQNWLQPQQGTLEDMLALIEEMDGGRIRATSQGWLVLDAVIADLAA